MSMATPITLARRVRIYTAVSFVFLSLLVAGFLAPSAQAAFGIAEFKGSVLDETSTPFTRAGGHPFAATSTIRFNTRDDVMGGLSADEQLKDSVVEMPPGFVGNPMAVPRCPNGLITNPEFVNGAISQCPANSQVGVADIFLGSTIEAPFDHRIVPVYNLIPTEDQPARFAFNALGVIATARIELRTGGDYGLTVAFRDTTQSAQLRRVALTFWGVPADPAHDAERGQNCIAGPLFCVIPGGASAGVARAPFLTLPADCSAGPMSTIVHANSWSDPSDVHTASFDTDADHGDAPMAVTGCENVPFTPDIDLQPTTSQADSPTGIDVDFSIPQQGLENPDGLASAHLKRAEVTLPEGMSVNPASADGLGACSPAEIGLDNASSPSCPPASKIGSVEVETPLLDEPLDGAVYLAQQGTNPFQSLLALYLVAEGSLRAGRDAGQLADQSPGQV